MTIEISAFSWVPPFAQGYVRDLRVRWALEEAGLHYEASLINGTIQNTDSYRAWQPFAQVPAYRDGEVEMFESGAIVLHLAARSEALSAADAAAQARTMTWVIAALSSVEPFVQSLLQVLDENPALAGAADRRARAEKLADTRLGGVSRWLGDKDYLEGRFTAGDLMMAAVLRELVECGFLARYPNLDAYVQRCEARPAFGRAMEAQMKPFRENAPA